MPPPGFEQPLSIQEEIKRFFRNQLSEQAEAQGFETFDESDDFEEEDPEIVPLTHHEVAGMTDAELAEYGMSQGYDIALDPLEGSSGMELDQQTATAKPYQENAASPESGVMSEAPPEMAARKPSD